MELRSKRLLLYNCRGCRHLHNKIKPRRTVGQSAIYNAKVRRVLIQLLKFITNFRANYISFLFLSTALDRERLKEALGLVRKFYSEDDDENPEIQINTDIDININTDINIDNIL